jgi:hypothetical protein
VLDSRKPVQIFYSDDISEAISKLHKRDRRPEEFFRQIPRFRDLTDPVQREKRASELHAGNAKLLQRVTTLADENQKDLGLLLDYLREHKVAEDLARKSLSAFAALAASKMIQALKRGFEWVDDNPQMWFEGFKFNSDGSYCLFDWVPRPSSTGQVIFGYRYWVGARVGHEHHYEYVMFPLKFVLPLFRDAVKGDPEAFYAWVLPQLLLIGNYYPIDQFPIADWQTFLLQGAGGSEWWSRHQPCPWPIIVDTISMAEM